VQALAYNLVLLYLVLGSRGFWQPHIIFLLMQN